MKTHYIKITTRTRSGEVKEYFEPVTAMHKCFQFKGERHVTALEAYQENEHPVVIGFDEGRVMLVTPGCVINFQEEAWTREIHMKRGAKTAAKVA